MKFETKGRALPAICDVTDLHSINVLADKVMDEFGRIDFVINNAAAARAGDRVPVVELDPIAWDKVMTVNLNGSFYMSHVFGKKLIEQNRGGAIINISSIGGKLMAPTSAAYSASKAGLHAMTPQQWDRIINIYIPLKRSGQPEEVGSMVVYLCTEQGAFVSGQLISIDGGQLAGR